MTTSFEQYPRSQCIECGYEVNLTRLINPSTNIHERLYLRLNKISPDRLEDMVQRMESLGYFVVSGEKI